MEADETVSLDATKENEANGAISARQSAVPPVLPPPRHRTVRLLVEAWQEAGKLRDSFLVTGGTLYVLGYIIWSFYASPNHIGLVSAFQSQHILAG